MHYFGKKMHKTKVFLHKSEKIGCCFIEVGFKMPVLCMFYGIIVRMYRELGGKHNIPHIHVEYSGQEAVIGLDGTVLEGKLPKSQMKLVDAWMEIHKDDLAANWTLLSNGEQFFRIDPLK